MILDIHMPVLRRIMSCRLAIVAALMLAAPSVGRAQSAARSASDQPSTNRETHRQHDSLAVHFLRAPKAKPAAGARTAAKQAGMEASDSISGAALRTTPLPTRARRSKP
jgi:hypothetical protein